MVKDPYPIPASEPESSLYTSTQIDTYPSSLKLAFIVIALLYVSQTSSTIRDYLGGRHLLVLYLSALCMRYSQHAKSGSVRFRDPDVALVCRLVNRGRCCHFHDMRFWETERTMKLDLKKQYFYEQMLETEEYPPPPYRRLPYDSELSDMDLDD